MGCSSSSHVCVHEQVQVQVRPSDFHEKYILGIKLGRGGFAQVRACAEARSPTEDGDTEEKAVKILEPKETLTLELLQKAAREETDIWKTIGNHPNCVHLYDSFYGKELCYMVMEKCTSGLLEALESMPELTEHSLSKVFAQMLSGISHCHDVKVVHRDIKPDNFLVGGKNGQDIKLTDFGLSVALPEQGKLPSKNVGTAPFMPPEMLTNAWYDEKADVWSFGVMMYVLLFGVFPYMPKHPSPQGMMQAIIENVDSPSFKPVQMGLDAAALQRSEDAVSMVAALLNRDPQERPSAQEALHMTWMRSALEDTRVIGQGSPSLKPMLHSAQKVGAFEARDPALVTNTDVMLNAKQMRRHSLPLPPMPSSKMTGHDTASPKLIYHSR